MPLIVMEIAVLLHFPRKFTLPTTNRPCGTLIVAGLGEEHALDHALRNAFVESVWPSDLAPKLTTLYVVAALTLVEFSQQHKIIRMRIETKGLNFGLAFLILVIEDEIWEIYIFRV